MPCDQRLESGQRQQFTHLCTTVLEVYVEAGMNSTVGGIAMCLLATICHLFIYCPISLCEWFWRLQRLHHIRKTMISSISLPPINHMVSHTQSWLSLYNPMDCNTPDSFVRRILPFPSPGDLPNPGIEPGSPALQVDSLLSKPLEKPQ